MLGDHRLSSPKPGQTAQNKGNVAADRLHPARYRTATGDTLPARHECTPCMTAPLATPVLPLVKKDRGHRRLAVSFGQGWASRCTRPSARCLARATNRPRRGESATVAVADRLLSPPQDHLAVQRALGSADERLWFGLAQTNAEGFSTSMPGSISTTTAPSLNSANVSVQRETRSTGAPSARYRPCRDGGPASPGFYPAEAIALVVQVTEADAIGQFRNGHRPREADGTIASFVRPLARRSRPVLRRCRRWYS